MLKEDRLLIFAAALYMMAEKLPIKDIAARHCLPAAILYRLRKIIRSMKTPVDAPTGKIMLQGDPAKTGYN
jgi:hypothetical protein